MSTFRRRWSLLVLAIVTLSFAGACGEEGTPVKEQGASLATSSTTSAAPMASSTSAPPITVAPSTAEPTAVSMTQSTDPVTGRPTIDIRYSYPPMANAWLEEVRLYENGKLVGNTRGEAWPTGSDGSVVSGFRTFATTSTNNFYALGLLLDHNWNEVPGSRVRGDTKSWNVSVEPGQVVVP